MTRRSSETVGRQFGLFVQIAAAVALTVALLGLTELVCGFLVTDADVPTLRNPWRTVEGDAVSSTLRAIGAIVAPLVKDVNLLWRNEPGASRTLPVNPHHFGRDEYWTTEINSEGFRGPERAFKGVRQGVYRILCIGDSITYGYSVDQDATFPRQLEALLRARYPGRAFEVINAGVPGWSWVQGLGYLETEGLALHPNLVIAAHGMNDQFWIAKITDSERIRYLEDPWVRRLQRINDLVEQTNMYRAAAKLVRSRPQQDSVSPGCEKQVQGGGACRRVAIPEIEAAVRAMRRLTRAAGVDLLVLNLDFLESPAVRGLRSAADTDHIPFLDLVAHFSALRRADEDARARSLGLRPAEVPPPDPENKQPAPAKDQRVLLRVLARNVDRASMSVRGASFPVAAFPFDQALYDDGTHGDEVANDHVYSGWIDIAGVVRVVGYKYYADGVPEFQPLPPLLSTQHDRVRPNPGNLINPVEVFGEQLLMVERAHPDRSGDAVIAADVANEIQQFSAFAAYAGISPRADARGTAGEP